MLTISRNILPQDCKNANAFLLFFIYLSNLLVFITARMIKPDGSPYFQVDAQGRPTSAGMGDMY